MINSPEIRALITAVNRLEEASRVSSSLRKAAKWERSLAKAASDFFKAQGKAIADLYSKKAKPVEALREAGEELPEEELRRLAAEQAAREAEELMKSVPEQLMLPLVYAADKAILEAFLLGAEEQMRSLQTGIAEEAGFISFNVTHPEATAFMQGNGARLVKQIDETTRDRLRSLLTEGIANGYSQDRIAKQIIEQFAEMAVLRPQGHVLTRANLIAQTETGNAYQEGNLQAARQLQASSGLAIEKGWLTSGDEKVDADICRANEEQGWINLDEPFQSGHMRPLGHPACRCSMLQRRKGSENHEGIFRKTPEATS